MAKSKKRMRLPNGIGSVHMINDGKRRRKPWRARVPSHTEWDDGVAKIKYINIGYYETEKEAIAALFDYAKNPYTLQASNATFKDMYDMWSAKRYPDLSKQSVGSYTAAFKHSTPLHNMKMRDIRSLHMEKIMQEIKGGRQTQSLIKTFWGQIFKYAIEHDIVEKNYAEFVSTRDKDEGTKRTAIPPQDIAKIWQAIDDGDEIAEVAMIYIYTGMRLSELLEVEKTNVDVEGRIIIGGKKTAAGKDRRIPIHKCILPFIEKRMQSESKYLIEGTLPKHKGKKLTSPSFAQVYWAKLMQKLGFDEYTVHYTRHTCATMMRTAGIDEDIRKLILGHASGDITDRYTHHPDSMLIEAIDKVKGRE